MQRCDNVSIKTEEISKTILKIIKSIVKKKKQNIEMSTIKEDDSLTRTFGMDSLDLAEFTVRIEDIYKVDVFEDSIIDTIGEVIARIEKGK